MVAVVERGRPLGERRFLGELQLVPRVALLEVRVAVVVEAVLLIVGLCALVDWRLLPPEDQRGRDSFLGGGRGLRLRQGLLEHWDLLGVDAGGGGGAHDGAVERRQLAALEPARHLLEPRGGDAAFLLLLPRSFGLRLHLLLELGDARLLLLVGLRKALKVVVSGSLEDLAVLLGLLPLLGQLL